MKVHLTMSDVSELTGYTPKQLRNLCDSGVLLPEQNGEGPGCFRYFGVMQVVALAYAAHWGLKGHSRELVIKIVDSLLDLSEKQLLAEFRKGRTHLIPCLDGPMKLQKWPDGSTCEAFDVKAVYDQVKAVIAKIATATDAMEVVPRGRRRGLARVQK